MSTQTHRPDKDTTLAFRCSGTTAHLVRAAAARQQITASDWLREAVLQALEAEEWSRTMPEDTETFSGNPDG